jgi:hypothetical protein
VKIEGHQGDWRQAEGALRGISSDEPAESVIRRLREAWVRDRE